jgi:hypothetical protein
VKMKYKHPDWATEEEKRFIENVKPIADLFGFKITDYQYGPGCGALILEKIWGETWEKLGKLVVIGIRYFLAAEQGPYFTVWDSAENKNGNGNGKKRDGVKMNNVEEFYDKNSYDKNNFEFSVQSLINIFDKKLKKYW